MFRLILLMVLLAAAAVQAQQPAGPSSSSQESSSSLDEQSGHAAPTQATAPKLPSGQVLEAEASLAKSDWAAAESKLHLWLASHPSDARALFDAGYAADAQDRLEDAVGLYRRAAEANPTSFEAHLSLGLLLARLKRPNEARLELATATQLDPGESGPTLKARAWRALAQIDRSLPDENGGDNIGEASSDLVEALKLSPETAEDTLLAASLAEQAEEFGQAEIAYHRLLTREPKSPEGNAGLAHLLLAEKKYSEAETFLRAALEQLPDDPALTAQLATVLAAEDKPEALPWLQKLHQAHPQDRTITRMLAEVLSESGDIAGSDALYANLLTAEPENAQLLVAHGQNLVRNGHFPEAFATFDKATKIDGSNPDSWSGLAFTASRLEKPDVAVHALEMRAKFAPENASTYFLWATSYDALHQKQQAVSYYKNFLQASAGKYTNQEWQAKQRLQILEK